MSTTDTARGRRRGAGRTYRRLGLALLGGAGAVLVHASGAEAATLSAFAPCQVEGAPGGTQCATLSVVEDRSKANSRRIDLPLVKVPSSSKTPAEPLFVLNGGPGEPNLSVFLPTAEIQKDRDVYYLGYRGADGSVVLDCPEIDALVPMPAILSEASRAKFAAGSRACAKRLRSEGYDLNRYSMFDVLDDLEDARKALGVERIDLISKSYGTRLAQYYARRNPSHIRRSVLAAANPPGHFVFSAYVNDRVLARFSELCAQDPACASQTSDMKATVLKALHLGATGAYPTLDDGKTQLALFGALYSRDGAIAFQKAALAAEKGDPAPLQQMGEGLAMGLKDVVWGDILSKGSFDAYHYPALEPTFVATQTSMGSSFDLLYEAFVAAWPRVELPMEYRRAAVDYTETLVLNGDLDVATPLLFVQAELMPYLPNGQLVVLRDFGHGDYRRLGSALPTAIAQYLRTGVVDRSLLQPDPYKFPQ